MFLVPDFLFAFHFIGFCWLLIDYPCGIVVVGYWTEFLLFSIKYNLSRICILYYGVTCSSHWFKCDCSEVQEQMREYEHFFFYSVACVVAVIDLFWNKIHSFTNLLRLMCLSASESFILVVQGTSLFGDLIDDHESLVFIILVGL